MKLTTIYLGIMVGTVSIVTSTFATEKTNEDEFLVKRMSLEQNPDTDYERDKFFEIHYTTSPTHSSIMFAFQASMQSILDEAKRGTLESPQNSEKTCNTERPANNSLSNQEYYKKHLLLKAETVYSLPFSFEGGYLFSPKQGIHALKKLGIDDKLLKEIDPNKFWMFSLRCLELPAPKLENDSNLLNSYLCVVNKLIRMLDMRLKEDAFALLGFTDLKGNILKHSEPSHEQAQDISARLMKHSYKDEIRSTEESVIKKIIENRKYKKIDGLDALLATIGHLDIFTMVCSALNEGTARSLNSEDYLSVSVRVAEKLDNNIKDDITPEVLETMKNLLGRTYNMLVLEEIKKNFEIALSPREKGFEKELVEGFY